MSDTTIDDVEAEFARIRREYRGIGEGAWASAKWYAEALVRSRAELQCALKDRTEERDALLADLRKCEQQLIAVTPVTHTSHDARVALVRQAIFTVLDEANPRTPGLAWDFNDDEQRVDFADRVASFIPSETRRGEAALKWAVSIFGEVAEDMEERAMRFGEEAVELVNAIGLSEDVMRAIVARVYGRAKGERGKEMGQAMLTLELLAESIGVDPHRCADVEFARVQAIPKEEWERRHAAKVAKGIAK